MVVEADPAASVLLTWTVPPYVSAWPGLRVTVANGPVARKLPPIVVGSVELPTVTLSVPAGLITWTLPRMVRALAVAPTPTLSLPLPVRRVTLPLIRPGGGPTRSV